MTHLELLIIYTFSYYTKSICEACWKRLADA